MKTKPRHRGRIAQIRIYLGKLLRMFVYQNDWKTLPMAALIAGLVTFAVGANLFKTQEGTMQGCFALVCVCVWNGFFNSIQVVCREREIIKREHRAGMHISSYVAAHMIYQMLICLLQTAIIIGVCHLMQVPFPSRGLISQSFVIDLAVTIFLTTYAADMLSLAISSLVHTTTTAMTVMPFMLIFQLIFSGVLVVLEGPAKTITDFTITKWGFNAFCTVGNYNGQPMVGLWNTIFKFRQLELLGQKPIAILLREIERRGLLETVLQRCGEFNQNPAYLYTAANLWNCWKHLLIMTVIFAAFSVFILEFVDKDKR